MYVPRPLLLAGSAAVLILAAVAAFLVLADGDEQARTLESYSYEARLEVVEQEDSSPLGVNEPRPDLVRIWYERPDKWRQELTFSDPKQRDLGSVNVSDGQRIWQYEGQTNSYYVQDRSSGLPESARGPLGAIFGFVLGPLPTTTIDDFFARYEGAGAKWRRLGTEKVLDKEAQVFEMEIGGEKTTFWIDADYLFVLRYEAGEKGVSGQWVRAEVTGLEYDPDIEAERFKFEPPAGARQVEPPSRTSGSSSGSASIGPGSTVSVPAGFLAPAYIPDGYVSVGQGTSHSSGGVSSIQLRFQPAGQRGEGGPYLLIEEQQRFGGLPESLKTGKAASVAGSDAYLSASGGVNKMVWWTRDHIISLTTNALPVDELQRIAESMR